MGIAKRMLALMLVVVLGLASAFTVSAAGSPDSGKEDQKKTATYPSNDVNSKDHVNKAVTSTVNSATSATATKVASNSKDNPTVEFEAARNTAGDKVDITVIGNGKKGVFDSKKGRKVKTAIIKSKASKVIVKGKAFKGSKIGTIQVTSKLVVFNKNAFKGTKQTSLVLKAKKASQLKFKKGSLKGLKKITIKGASKKQKKKIKKLLKKAGFKGTIE